MAAEPTRAVQQWQPTSVQDLQTIGGVMAKSGFFADSKEASQAIVKILAGQEMGFGPFASMVGVYVIKGRPTYAANLIAAAIKRTRYYNYRVKTWTNTECVLEFFEQGESVGESSFTIADAKTAELTSGPNGHSWVHYPRNMLFARALTNGARVYCPDVFGGAPVYTPDELGARIEPDSGAAIIEHSPEQLHGGLASQQQVGRIHQLTRDLGWPEARYRDFLQDSYGVQSSTDLTADQADSCIGLMEAERERVLLAPLTDAAIPFEDEDDDVSDRDDPLWRRYLAVRDEARTKLPDEVLATLPLTLQPPIARSVLVEGGKSIRKAIDEAQTVGVGR